MTAENMEYFQLEFSLLIKTPKAIAWDLGDTLVRLKMATLQKAVDRINSEIGKKVSVLELEDAIRQEWLARTGLEEEQKIKAVKNEKDERNYWLPFYRSVIYRLGIKRPSDGLIYSFAEMQADPGAFECLPGVHQTLKKLSEKGITLILISNAFPSAYKILEHHKIGQYFDHIVLSYKISSLKPEPIIYKHALHLAKIPAHAILFIDDRLKFVQGARKVGMRAVWLNSYNNQQSADWDGYHIKNVKEVLGLAGFPTEAPSTFFQSFNALLAERPQSPVC